MPLTPLGRQLRSVLANIGPVAGRRNTRRIPCDKAFRSTRAPVLLSPKPLLANRFRSSQHVSSRYQSATAAANVPQPESSEAPEIPGDDEPVQSTNKLTRRRLNRLTRVDRITEALKHIGRDDVTPPKKHGKANLSHLNVRENHGRKKRPTNGESSEIDQVPSLGHAKEITLETILGKYIQHAAAVTETGQAEWMATFDIQPAEAALLEARGYELGDLAAWADIVSEPDSLEAASALAHFVSAHIRDAVPVFLVSYLLRRPHISAPALRVIAQQTQIILRSRAAWGESDHLPTNAVFIVFQRLVRHVREVWPLALKNLTEILLESLPHNNLSSKDQTESHLASLSYMLNKAMALLAVPTAIEPFKNNVYQEEAIVNILRAMAEHDPPLQINREGYRAVILVQLAQRKTTKNRQWAELKILSWPPWKEDRTAIDADITHDDHGMSKARQTLARMREAGYGPRDWENVATIYSGWDVDDTPVIQTLVQLGTGGKRFASGGAAWAARITTTRTIQEAWACYLAYEDAKLPPDQTVYLAVLRKLHKWQMLQRSETRPIVKPTLRIRKIGLYPGDTQEIEPLPPSTHLYTYTRTAPPPVGHFQRQLVAQGIVFEGYCLAFLVSHASTLRRGIDALLASKSVYPEIVGLVSLHSNVDVSRIPTMVFVAFLQLLSRFSKTSFSSAISPKHNIVLSSYVNPEILEKVKLNVMHPLVHAIELLRRRKPIHRPAWNTVLQALGHETSLGNISNAYLQAPTGESTASNEQVQWHGSMTAHRLARRVSSLMKETHLDLDIVGFQALCHITENFVAGCWKLLRYEESVGPRPQSFAADGKPLPSSSTNRPLTLLRSSNASERLSAEFRNLVGGFSDTPSGSEMFPDLLVVPGPALLHAYIRALGWWADYEGILKTIRWMVRHQSELAERRGRGHNDEALMRRAIIAVRVFLERSWLSSENRLEREGESRLAKQLNRLEAPVPIEMLREVRELVESVEDWGGWPSDEEVEGYVSASEKFGGFAGEVERNVGR